MRLTKARERALHTALSIDDILYEKFRRLNEELSRRERGLRRKSSIRQVLKKEGKVYWRLQILAVESTPEGLTVICQ